jgi:hypothetical protein
MMNLKPANSPKPNENVCLLKLSQTIIVQSINSWRKATLRQVGSKTIQTLHLSLLGQVKQPISLNLFSRITSLLGRKMYKIPGMPLLGLKILKIKQMQLIINLLGWRIILLVRKIIAPLLLGWSLTMQIRFSQIIGNPSKQQKFNAKRKS